MDSSLNWDTHIEKTIKKCNSLLYMLGRMKKYLNLQSRKLFFNAYILPHLDYCSTIWGNYTKENLDHIIKGLCALRAKNGPL